MCISAAIITAGTAAFGAFQSDKASKKEAKARKEITRETQGQERLRAEQMRLETQQKERQARREAARAAAIANSNATAAGAANSSADGGGQGQIISQLAYNLGVNNQASRIGADLFSSNAREAGYAGQAATAQAQNQFGQMLFSNSQAIGQLGSQASSMVGGLFATPFAVANDWGNDMTVYKPI